MQAWYWLAVLFVGLFFVYWFLYTLLDKFFAELNKYTDGAMSRYFERKFDYLERLSSSGLEISPSETRKVDSRDN